MSTKVGNLVNLVRQFLRSKINKQAALERCGTDQIQPENRLLPYNYRRIDDTINNNNIIVNQLLEWVKRQNSVNRSKIPNLSQTDAKQLCALLAQRNVDLCEISNRCIWSDQAIKSSEAANKYDDQLLKHILNDFAKHVYKGCNATPAGNNLVTKYNEISLFKEQDEYESPVSELCLPTVKRAHKIKKNILKGSADKPLQSESKEKNAIDISSADNKKISQQGFIKSPAEIARSSNKMLKICQKKNVRKMDDIYQQTERYDELNIEVNMPSKASSATARQIKKEQNKSGINFL